MFTNKSPYSNHTKITSSDPSLPLFANALNPQKSYKKNK